MILKTYNIDIPITPGVMPPVIHIGQYVSACQYICHLKNDDGTDYTIPATTTATFTGCNPRREVFELEANVDTGANTISIVPKNEATSMFGEYGATLNLFYGDDRLTPIVILMDVQKAGATDEEIAGAANFPDAVTEAVNDWLEDNIEEGQLGDLYVPRAPQAEKTDAMTQPVGMDEDGKLWTTPGGGSGAVTPASIVTATGQMTTAQKTSTRNNINAAPATNIAKSALASGVQASLNKADTALQAVSGENVLDAVEDLNASQQGLFRGYIAAETAGAAAAVQTNLDAVTAKIPSAATASNQLADKAWVLAQGGGGGGTVEGAVRYDTSQALDEIQKAIARGNIDAEQSGAAAAVQTDLNTVKAKIPTAASASNQLADKAWVLQQGGGSGGGGSDLPQTIVVSVDTSGGGGPVATLENTTEQGLSYSAVRSMLAAGPVNVVTYIDQNLQAGFNWYFAGFDGTSNYRILRIFAIVSNGTAGYMLYMADLDEDQNGVMTGPMSNQTIGDGNAINPVAQTKTAAQMASGVYVGSNTIYTVSGEATGFTITNSAPPTMTPGMCTEIRLTTGSSAITTPTWPSWCKFIGGWDGKFSANAYYKIMIDDAGNVVAGAREVSA